MSLLRALSTTKGRRAGYDKLQDDHTNLITNNNNDNNKNEQKTPVLKRVMSVPSRVLLFGSSSRKVKTTPSSSSSSSSSSSASESSLLSMSSRWERRGCREDEGRTKVTKGGKIHPVFGLFDGRSWSKRKVTSNPDFSRYTDYLKEGQGGGVTIRRAATEQGR